MSQGQKMYQLTMPAIAKPKKKAITNILTAQWLRMGAWTS